MSKKRTVLIVIGVIIALLLCCCAAGAVIAYPRLAVYSYLTAGEQVTDTINSVGTRMEKINTDTTNALDMSSASVDDVEKARAELNDIGKEIDDATADLEQAGKQLDALNPPAKARAYHRNVDDYLTWSKKQLAELAEIVDYMSAVMESTKELVRVADTMEASSSDLDSIIAALQTSKQQLDTAIDSIESETPPDQMSDFHDAYLKAMKDMSGGISEAVIGLQTNDIARTEAAMTTMQGLENFDETTYFAEFEEWTEISSQQENRLVDKINKELQRLDKYGRPWIGQ